MFIVLTTQLYLVMYILLFAAAIKLRYSQPNLERPFKVPGGKKGIWILGGAGILSSMITGIICFFPPGQLTPGNEWNYIVFLCCSIFLSIAAPFWLTRIRKPSPSLG
jgi:glutamate:GABA antiporter